MLDGSEPKMVNSDHTEQFEPTQLSFDQLLEAAKLAQHSLRVTEQGVEFANGVWVCTFSNRNDKWRVVPSQTGQGTRPYERIYHAHQGKMVNPVAKQLVEGLDSSEELIVLIKGILNKTAQEDGFRLID